jgi:hypothetical protein
MICLVKLLDFIHKKEIGNVQTEESISKLENITLASSYGTTGTRIHINLFFKRITS